MLAEFRTALSEEIDAAKKQSSSSAVPLANGTLIGQVGGSFQYRFEIENALNLPADAPGNLVVPGGGAVVATVISVAGLSLTLSVQEDLGSFIPVAHLQSDLTYLMRILIERLESLAGKPNPSGARLLAEQSPSGQPLAIKVPGLNPEQTAAVASTLGRDTTFIWGPPGTGKTHVIGAIGTLLADRKQSLLLVSHTNTAVDQALLRVAERAEPDLLAAGKILRVGEPRDRRVIEIPDLLLETHVARQAAKLSRRRDDLMAVRESAMDELGTVRARLSVAEWLEAAPMYLAETTAALSALHHLEKQASAAWDQHAQLAIGLEMARSARDAAQAARDAVPVLDRCNHELTELDEAAPKLREDVDRTAAELVTASAMLAAAEKLERCRWRLRDLGESADLERTVQAHRSDMDGAQAARDQAVAEHAEALRLLSKVTTMGGLMRRWQRLPDPEHQNHRVMQLAQQIPALSAQIASAERRYRGSEENLRKAQRLAAQLSEHSDVPRVALAQGSVVAAEGAARRAVEAAERSQHRREQLLEHLDGARRSLYAFAEAHGDDDPVEIYRRSVAQLDACDCALEQARSTGRQARTRRQELERDLSERVSLLRQWKLTTDGAANAEEALRAVSAAADVAMTVTSGQTVQALQARCNDLNARITDFEAKIEELERALCQVEEQVIADALVIGTTLTRSYLRDSLWERRFDTVVLDEASMAPIPALWAVASRADRAAVAVGDWKQLPPIAQSNHELAERWLGRDIFEAAGVKDPASPPHRVDLLRQYRMHPQISAIVNRLIYGGRLVDDPTTAQQTPDSEWFNQGWWHSDVPVQVIDTGPADAWVTSVVRGSGVSRLNFLSATVCLDLAHAMLRPDRRPLPSGDPPRMLMISPYRPHALLTERLIREDHLVGEAVAGTVHAFQGSEADVVILDLVNDEPHWKVGMFDAKRDESTRRLLTVALTRARSRLIVVGDVDYIRKQSARAFLGGQFIPALLDHAERVNALDVIPAHLSARVSAARSAGVGGPVEADRERLIVTQDRFFPLLISDLNAACQRVVIYSPFITANRLTEIHPPLRATVDRGVPVFVVTKPLQDRPARDQSTYQKLQRQLEDWGVTIVPKRNMHEKLVFIDHDILWTGSLNPLSYSNTQEVMERRRSRAVADDYAKALRLDDLLAGHQQKENACPICAQPIVATEGSKEPFYWRCLTKHCYSRSIGQPPLTDGVITCRTCSAPVVFGSWGDKDVWRCTKDNRHRQQIARGHLKLPKMRALIPAHELRRLQS